MSKAQTVLRAPTRLSVRVKIAAAIGGCVVLLVAAWLFGSLVQPVAESSGDPVQVTVPYGARLGSIADSLHRDHVIHSALFFKLRVWLDGRGGDLQPGVYVLRRGMPYSAVITRLSQGPSGAHLTIPEGRSRADVAAIASRALLTGDYLEQSVRSPALDLRAYGAASAPDLEGFLFPGTYAIDPHASVTGLVDQQLELFKREFATVDLGWARSRGLSAYDVLNVASMVDAEAKVPAERRLVASVIYNRLDRHMPLGVDATVRFATGNWTQPLTQDQLSTPSPYNTRTNIGLPPGPIDSPGLAAIAAAAHPPDTPFLFYVAKPGTCGEHNFSQDPDHFQRDVRAYEDARAQNAGREPTTCPGP